VRCPVGLTHPEKKKGKKKKGKKRGRVGIVGEG
jgi:hypothetical protein